MKIKDVLPDSHSRSRFLSFTGSLEYMLCSIVEQVKSATLNLFWHLTSTSILNFSNPGFSIVNILQRISQLFTVLQVHPLDSYTYTKTQTHIRRHRQRYTDTNTHPNTHTHRHTHTHTDTDTQTHTHTHTHTDTHIRTHILITQTYSVHNIHSCNAEICLARLCQRKKEVSEEETRKNVEEVSSHWGRRKTRRMGRVSQKRAVQLASR